ncbi:MAG TPA: hypothetical protein VGO18_32975, partial [Steroidobacteraceae bacterium]|nr:hypothetical protein [Steroidobacteraceae bacterium]
ICGIAESAREMKCARIGGGIEELSAIGNTAKSVAATVEMTTTIDRSGSPDREWAKVPNSAAMKKGPEKAARERSAA